MSSEKLALAVAIAVFAGGVIRLLLQRILPESSTTGGPRDMIGAVVGLPWMRFILRPMRRPRHRLWRKPRARRSASRAWRCPSR